MLDYEYALKVLCIVAGILLFSHFILGGVNKLVAKALGKKMWKIVHLDVNIGDKFIKKGYEDKKYPPYAVVTWKDDEYIYIEDSEYDAECRTYYVNGKERLTVEELYKLYTREKNGKEEKKS